MGALYLFSKVLAPLSIKATAPRQPVLVQPDLEESPRWVRRVTDWDTLVQGEFIVQVSGGEATVSAALFREESGKVGSGLCRRWHRSGAASSMVRRLAWAPKSRALPERPH